MGWRATKRCPGSASESAAETFSLAGTGFTPLISAEPWRNFRRNYEYAISGKIGCREGLVSNALQRREIGGWDFLAHFCNAQMWKTKGIPPLRSRSFHE